MSRPSDEEFLARIAAHEANEQQAENERLMQIGRIVEKLPRLINVIAQARMNGDIYEKYPHLADRTGFSAQSNEETIVQAQQEMKEGIEQAIAAQHQALHHNYAADQLRTALGITNPPESE